MISVRVQFKSSILDKNLNSLSLVVRAYRSARVFFRQNQRLMDVQFKSINSRSHRHELQSHLKYKNQLHRKT